MAHESACRRFRYLRYLLPLVLLEVTLLYVLMGWGALKGLLPPSAWGFVDGLFTSDLGFVINFMLAARLVMAVGVALDLLLHKPTRLSSESA